VCNQISELFADHDYAQASLLDAAASEAADLAAATLEKVAANNFRMSGIMRSDSVALRYSPGYCGWHVSGQKALFARLQPDEIDISLRESCLMEPLKSVSGVVVGGPLKIHQFNPDYPFCADCSDYGCRDRIRTAARDGLRPQ
jgi:cobalamin-dependent methionine synthase I